MKRSALTLTATACVAALGVPSPALAVTCDSISGAATAPTIYIEGATAVGSFLAPLQQALSIDPNPINLVYIGDGGCLGASNFFLNAPISRRTAPVYYAGESKETCDLPTASFARAAPTADIAVSDVYAPSCGTLSGGQLPPHVGDFLGPIQTMAFAVPTTSTQRAMSAKGAYFVFGFGAGSGVAPWTVNSSIYRRDGSSAVQALLASAIGVPLLRWMGVDASGLVENMDAGLSNESAVVNALANDPSPEHAIGILSDADIDVTAAGRVRVLAYKDNDQSCAYYPDSTATARDKANVRDGHYTLWGPIHFFTYVDSRGVPQNPLVGRVISYLIGTAAAPGGIDIVQTDADNRFVPSCAMHVGRSVEMGPLMSVAPPASCSCYYDYVASGQSTCQACAKEADCPPSAPVCNLSHPVAFCETQ